MLFFWPVFGVLSWRQIRLSSSVSAVRLLNYRLLSFEKTTFFLFRAAEQEIVEAELQASNAANKDNNNSKSGCGLRFLGRKKDPALSDLLSDGPNERKHSAEQQSTRLKPSLRMKAFKNRQDTFHSLASCCNPTPEVSI